MPQRYTAPEIKNAFIAALLSLLPPDTTVAVLDELSNQMAADIDLAWDEYERQIEAKHRPVAG